MKRFVLSALSLSLMLSSMTPVRVFGNTSNTQHSYNKEHNQDHDHGHTLSDEDMEGIMETGYTEDGLSVEEMHLKEHARGFSVTGGDIEIDTEGVVNYGDALKSDLIRGYLSAPKQDENAPIIDAKDLYFDTIEDVSIKDITKGVKVTDKNGKDITDKLTYKTDFIEDMPGKFYVEYKAEDDNRVVATKTIKITVANDITYASDLPYGKWSSYAGPVNDKSIVGGPIYLFKDGEFVPYKKGIGMHSSSEITINIEGKGYEYFISDIGANSSGNWNTSVDFKVYVDGREKFSSGLMKHTTPAQQVKIDVRGAKNIRLQLNQNINNIHNDHANWGGARFVSVKESNVEMTNLRAQIAAAEKVDKSNYEKHELENLEEATKIAKYTVTNEMASEEQVEDVMRMLLNAIDKLPLNPLDIFTDETFSKLKNEYVSVDKINKIIEDSKKDGIYAKYEIFLNDALKLAKDNNIFAEETFILTRNGRDNAKAKGFSYELTSSDPTGLYIIPGQTVKFYVDSDKPVRVVLPKSPYARYVSSILLQPGVNTYTLPNNSFLVGINFANQYSEDEQPVAPKVRIEGATPFPVYIKGKTKMEDMKKELQEYLKNTSFSPTDAPFKNGVSADGKFANMVQIVSDNVVISTSAAGFYQELLAIEASGKTIDYYLDEWDKMINMYFQYVGFSIDPKDKGTKNYRPNGRIIIQIGGSAGGGPWGTAGNYFATIRQGDPVRREGGLYSTVLRESVGTSWGLWHEIAHVFENGPLRKMEMTTNLPTLIVQDMRLGAGNNRIQQENRWNRLNNYTIHKNGGVDGVFEELAILYQLNGYLGYDWYGKVGRGIREDGNFLEGEWRVFDKFAIGIAKATGVDVTSHFEHFGKTIQKRTKNIVKQYAKKTLTEKVYLTDGTVMNPNSVPFAEDTKVTLSVKRVSDTENMGTIMTNAPANSLLAYEIYKDGKLVNITKSSTFVDPAPEGTEYQVIAVDRKYNERKTDKKKAVKPKAEIYKNNITIQVGKTINDLKNQIKIVDQDGEGIPLNKLSDFTLSNIALNEKGIKDLTVTANYRGKKLKETMKVNVVSKQDYLSNLAAKSTEERSSNFVKDKTTNGRAITLLDGKKEISFAKGISMQGNSDIEYDIKGKHYETFSAKIGLDKVVNGANAQATFIVYIDGEEKFKSENMTVDTDMKDIEVTIPKDAKSIKLIVSSKGVASNAVWADAMLTTNKEAIDINYPKDISIQKGEEPNNLSSYIYARDIRGNKISGIQIDTTKINKNQVGIHYATVTANANDITETIEVPVQVVAGKKYLSDIQADSVSIGWGDLKIDRAPDNSTISLLDENGIEVVYPKGLGTHGPAELVYNIAGKGYDKFKAKIGIDSGKRYPYEGQTVVEFDVFVDNKLVYESGTMTGRSAQKDININIKNAKEIKLVVDDLGSAAVDHAVWGDAMFTTDNEIVNIDTHDDIVIAKTVENDEVKPLTGKTLNVLDYISKHIYAEDTRGNKVQDIIIDTEAIDTTRAGLYKAKVTAKANGVEKTEEIPVKVVAKRDYLSDLEAQSASTGWNGLVKDRASNRTIIDLIRADGKRIEFTKGIGTHAPAQVVYNVEGKGYDTFLAKIGVDGNAKLPNREKAKVKFTVYVDGKVVYDSSTINAWQSYKNVEVDIRNAKEVKLVVDSLGDAEADHAVWADAMFVTSEEPADITVDKNIVMEVGEKIDLKKYIYAKDGNNKEVTEITIDDKDVNKEVVGKYNAKATVVNNGIKKDVTIPVEVVAKKAYLSDLQEKSATVGWKTLQKDKAPNGSKINLLKSTGEEVVFEKGLGAHAYSEIVYNIEGRGYDKFLAKVGVDRDLKTHNKEHGKVQFKVYVDGKIEFDSKEIHVSEPYKDVEINIPADAKEVKLVADSLGTNTRDHAIWADAMFTAKENPVIIHADEDITIEVGEEVDLADKVYATYQTGHKIDSIQIDTTNVDTTIPNNYTAKASISIGNEIITKDIPVKVVAQKLYLSDLQEKEGFKTGFNGLMKDKASNGSSIDLLRADGKEIVFKKGLGTHAPAEVIYNVAGKGYDTFLAKVGVDRNAKVADKRRANVQFKVFADDTQVYDSGEINVWQTYKDVRVDIPSSAKEIKLVVDGLGDYEADHAVWADAMFVTNESPINAYVDEDITIIANESIELRDYIYVIDKTGTEISNENISIDMKNVNRDIPGEYIAKAIIKHSGKEIMIDIPITVVKDKAYLSDLTATNITIEKDGLQKDKAPGTNGSEKITLTKDTGEKVEFEKGLGAHANSEITYNIKGKGYETFLAKAGVDRSVRRKSPNETTTQFIVYVDGKETYKSDNITSRHSLQDIKIDVTGAEEIKLVANAVYSSEFARAVWADAMFTSSKELPKISKFSLEEKEEIEATKMTKATEVIEATDIVEAGKIENTEEVIPEMNDNNEEIVLEVNDNNEEVTLDNDNDSQPDTNIGADDTQNNTPNGDNLEQDSSLDSNVESLELLVNN